MNRGNKILKIVFINMDDKEVAIEATVKEWLIDFEFNCEFTPDLEVKVLSASIDGEDLLAKAELDMGECDFDSLWGALGMYNIVDMFDDQISNNGEDVSYTSEDFAEWIDENIDSIDGILLCE